jgi:hypothetical protein
VGIVENVEGPSLKPQAHAEGNLIYSSEAQKSGGRRRRPVAVSVHGTEV